MIVAEANTFESEVLNSEKPVLVYFWATWCQSCKKMSPQMETLATETGDRYKIVKVEIDTNPELAEKYDIMSTPTLMLFRPGRKPAEIQAGFAAKAWVVEVLEKYL